MLDIVKEIGDILRELFISKNGKFVKGFLVDINNTECEVWFPYSLEAMKLLSVGSLLAVPNFAGINVFADEEEKLLKEEMHFSILQVKSKKAVHYTIESLKQNPETIELEKEFSKLVKDWERTIRDNESPNLKIIIQADLTEREILVPRLASEKQDVKVQFNQMEPVQGHEVYLLNDEMVERVINTGVIGKDTSMIVGSHKFYQNVNVFLEYNQLLRRHFGVFATTGAGKSNLISNLIYTLLTNDRLNTNVVIFDVNNEYTTLLIDQLVDVKDTHIIILDESYGGEALRDFLKGALDRKAEAAQELSRTVVVPNALKTHRDALGVAIAHLLEAGKVKIYVEGYSVERLFYELRDFVESMKFSGRNAKQHKEALLKLVDILNNRIKEETDTSSNLSMSLAEAIVILIDDVATEILGDEKAKLEDKINELKGFVLQIADAVAKNQNYLFSIGLEGIFQILNDDEKSLVILLAENDNVLRSFAYYLIKTMYDFRKSRGVIEPPVLFFFDEADLFIPKDAGTKDDTEKKTIKQSKEACITLARRGRKYGLGLGVSTQRVAQNDASIIAQLNTFFISKLAKKYDRQVIAESYGISEELLAVSGTFVPGDWLILSSSATGIKNTPIPVHMPNAEDRIKNFLEKELKRAIEKWKRGIFEELAKIHRDRRTFLTLEENEYHDIEPILYS